MRDLTTVTVIHQSVFIRIPPSIIKSPAYYPSDRYTIELQANGDLLLSPLTLTEGPKGRSVGK